MKQVLFSNKFAEHFNVIKTVGENNRNVPNYDIRGQHFKKHENRWKLECKCKKNLLLRSSSLRHRHQISLAKAAVPLKFSA